MQKFYRLSVNIVKILTLLLAVFLFIGSFLTTCYAENMETQQVLLLSLIHIFSQICFGKTAMPGGPGSGICCLPWEPLG